MLRKLLAASLVGALLSACSLAPKYERPAAPIQGSWPESAGKPGDGPVAAADLGWRDLFGDPRLQQLVAIALENNRDLRVAVLNVQLARAQYRIERSALFPTVAANAGADITGGGAANDFFSTQTIYSVGVGVTAFELDLFGRVRSLKDQALEEYFATVEAQRAAHLSLVAEVATQYLIERALDEQLAIAKQTQELVGHSYDLAQRLFSAGVRSELDVRTAEGQVATARAEVARLTRLRAQAQNALVLLLGQPLPTKLPPPVPLAEQRLLGDLPAGLPSQLLVRRPDILAAEHLLMAANANIGAARAAFFPRISLTAFAGLASGALDELFTGGAGLWAFSPDLTVPIFTGGRNTANLDASKVRKRIEIARYERSIQEAFREVADALAARATLGEELAAQIARVEAESKRFTLSELRYKNGIESYLNVLSSQRDLYSAQTQLVAVRSAQLTTVIQLYKALGGGWLEQTKQGK